MVFADPRANSNASEVRGHVRASNDKAGHVFEQHKKRKRPVV